ncbi:MAG TPA: ROK family transcriptional regulator, partial [Steroidobacteraceae bacterium]|nr:ROK family transcriptional regulator [Steroidobacteraceae bacterium]
MSSPPMASVTRQLSRRSVFEALLHRSPISRADLAKVTGLSKQTMSEVIDAFEQQGLVHQVGRTSGNVGRTAVLYELSPEGGHVLGIDLGARRLTVALADIAGRVLAEADEPTDSRGGAWALDQIARLSDRLARDNHTHPSRIRSIVLATPGVVNPRSGAIEMAPNITGLGHLNVVGLLGEKLGSPVTVENDINLALLGEIWHGCAQNVANVAFLALGSGVGLGLYVNGQLVRGENGAAGEIGYLPIGGDPLQAEARLQGCLEYQVGATGVVRRYREAGGGSEVDSVRQIFERAQAGDSLAADVVDETARLTALAAATVIATVDPQLLVLGGSVGARPDFADKVARVLLQLASRPVEIRTSTLGNRAGVVGALSVALRRLHDDAF